MGVDFKKLDAALFAIQCYLKEVAEKNGLYQDHAEWFLNLTRNLRTTVSNELEQTETIRQMPKILKFNSRKADVEDARRKPPFKKKRAKDKGQMSQEQRRKVSLKMKAFWSNRRRLQKAALRNVRR